MADPPYLTVGFVVGIFFYGVAAVFFFIGLLADWIDNRYLRCHDGALFLATITLIAVLAAVWPLSLFGVAVGKFAEKFCCNEVNTCCGIHCCGSGLKKKEEEEKENGDSTLPGDVEMTPQCPDAEYKRTEPYACPGRMEV